MTHAPHFQYVLAKRLARRDVLRGASAVAAASLAGCASARPSGVQRHALGFASVPATVADTVTVPDGYTVRTLIRYGDPLFAGDDVERDPRTLTSEEQARRFGANNDMIALFPLRWSYPWPSDLATGAILAANHEYFDPAFQIGAAMRDPEKLAQARPALYASVGVTIARLSWDRRSRTWSVEREAWGANAINRRITPFSEVVFDGPAKDHPWVQSAAQVYRAAYGSSDGIGVPCGTLANCAGGITPWGTYLSAEENFQTYFFTRTKADPTEVDARLLQDARSFGYNRLDANSAYAGLDVNDLSGNPSGPAAYGWVVEIDPYDPSWRPKKRTALGRRKGECASTTIAHDGRVAVYSGDDQRSEHVYKFVSKTRFDPSDRIANRDVLSEGDLYAARFESDGTGRWLKIDAEAANAHVRDPTLRFVDQADALVRARFAASLMGATPMDRPEDIEVVQGADFRGSGVVLVVCTKSSVRAGAMVANPRRMAPGESDAPNPTGHILKLIEDNGDHASETFRWEVFVLAGDPDGAAPIVQTAEYGAVNVSTFVNGAATFAGARFACPDNLAFDGAGNVFISTDGNDEVFSDCNDQVVACAAEGEGPRQIRRFLVGPLGAEICGPFVTPDRSVFFCAIQHPGEVDPQGVRYMNALMRDPNAQPCSSFPDGGWPRSAIVYVTKDDGGPIGT